MTARGIATVVRLELRQRVRSSRWQLTLLIWFLAIGGLTGLTWAATGVTEASEVAFSAVFFFVLTLGLLVAPTLGATTINADRNAGVLATLLITRITPWDLVTGKILAAWLTSLGFLVTASPFLALPMMAGESLLRVLVALLMMALVMLFVCCIAVGWSSLTSGTAASAVLTYLTMAVLCVFTVVLFVLTTPLVTVRHTYTTIVPESYSGESSACVAQAQTSDRAHTEYTWWLLAANPYVVVADAVPEPAERTDSSGRRTRPEDALSWIRIGVRTAMAGPADVVDYCHLRDGFETAPPRSAMPAWPWGLLLLGAGAAFSVVTAARRLRTPVRKLARGTRIA